MLEKRVGISKRKKVGDLQQYPKALPEKDEMPSILYIQNYIRKTARLSSPQTMC